MAESSCAKRWLPLEANPDVMNQVEKHLIKIYINGSLNHERLKEEEKPVLAVLFLYPLTPQSEARIKLNSETKLNWMTILYIFTHVL
ncbi:hypothetical protein K7X08_004710 [Anisodus acutangulus]|uniref:Uncharacterized protein n=1 Tax=Anisodus acutangulus TaxID=402998 RepID=A0A9Q1MFM1_9SOLA|nr:hypothetical protein K7X08_004710 [Anisodus acutangulus]